MGVFHQGFMFFPEIVTRDRIHSALDYMTPYEYLDAWRNGRISSTQTKVNS